MKDGLNPIEDPTTNIANNGCMSLQTSRPLAFYHASCRQDVTYPVHTNSRVAGRWPSLKTKNNIAIQQILLKFWYHGCVR